MTGQDFCAREPFLLRFATRSIRLRSGKLARRFLNHDRADRNESSPRRGRAKHTVGKLGEAIPLESSSARAALATLVIMDPLRGVTWSNRWTARAPIARRFQPLIASIARARFVRERRH